MAWENIFFDLDGTLVDSLTGIEFSIDCALAEAGFPPRRAAISPLLGPPIPRILRSLVPDASGPLLQELERAFRASYDTVGWRKTALYDGARETLEALAERGHRLLVVTNKPGRPTGCILDLFGLRHLFWDVVSRDSVSPGFASKAAMLQFAMSRHTLAASGSVLVGDGREDCEAGSAVGIPVIFVDRGSVDLWAESPARPYMRITRLSELLAAVLTGDKS